MWGGWFRSKDHDVRNRSRQWNGSITQKRASQRSQEGSTTSPIHPKREEIKREREREREREIRVPIPLLRISLSRSLCLRRSSLAPPLTTPWGPSSPCGGPPGPPLRVVAAPCSWRTSCRTRRPPGRPPPGRWRPQWPVPGATAQRRRLWVGGGRRRTVSERDALDHTEHGGG